MPHTPVRPHQDMLARITREITATEESGEGSRLYRI